MLSPLASRLRFGVARLSLTTYGSGLRAGDCGGPNSKSNSRFNGARDIVREKRGLTKVEIFCEAESRNAVRREVVLDEQGGTYAVVDIVWCLKFLRADGKRKRHFATKSSGQSKGRPHEVLFVVRRNAKPCKKAFDSSSS